MCDLHIITTAKDEFLYFLPVYICKTFNYVYRTTDILPEVLCVLYLNDHTAINALINNFFCTFSPVLDSAQRF